MGLKILVAQARGGKTDWVVKKSLKCGMGLTGSPFVVVPSELKVDDFKQRLAAHGGTMGVQVGTFRELSRTILDKTSTYPILISETSQEKLLQKILTNIPLKYFEGIKYKPGFVQTTLQIVRELEAGGIAPENIMNAIDKEKMGERLGEIALIYQVYVAALNENNWVDSVGLTWKACEMLSKNSQKIPIWDSVIIDGFDDLSPIQLDLIRNLAAILPEITITLTGEDENVDRPLVHKRFNRLHEKLRSESKPELIRLQYLDELDSRIEPLVKLEKQLFEPKADQLIEAGDAIKLMAVPDRESEVREALRWIRSLIIQGEISPGDAALITRNQEPYRAMVSRISGEYHLPVKILGGLPLFDNPVVSAILGLINLANGREEGLTWHEVRTNWQSPYFNWQMIGRSVEKTQNQADHKKDGNNLVKIARWGSVIQGYDQWQEAFRTLIQHESTTANFLESIPDILPTGEDAEVLWDKFASFVEVILPPEGEQPLEVHIGWVESLLGEMNLELNHNQDLGIFLNILESTPDLIQRDWSALKKLSDIFRELLWSNLSLGTGSMTFGIFLDQLTAVIKRSSYQPIKSEQDFILFADSTEVSGMTFKAVALIGLAEGEFPGSIKEDPFLRDDDRNILQSKYGLPLRTSTDSAEAEYFYESVSLPSRYLLLTRPRIADNGALWQPSPYWEEILRVVDIEPDLLTNRNVPSLGSAASINEIIENIADSTEDNNSPIWKVVQEKYPQLWQRINLAQRIISARNQNWNNSYLNFNGALMHLSQEITRRYPDDHIWSASRLENYQTCPFNFFVNNLLGLEKPEPPSEGLDARQLGNIYHHILEDLYRTVESKYKIQNLLDSLPQVAQKVFKEAPLREGFRETAWWKHTQEEILTKIKQSIIVLESMDPSFDFHRAEQRFGLGRDSNPQLEMNIKGQGSYQLRGFIDRVDHDQQGNLRIIDYKTSGAFGFDNQAVREGKKLQLPLYALAAQEALNLGTVKEGFYFHVRSAQPSSFKMSSFWNEGKKGVEAAMESARMNGWLAVRSIQEGKFSPKPPKNGCPPYCPAIDFCWQYRPKRW